MVYCAECKKFDCGLAVGLKNGFRYVDGIKLNVGYHIRATETAQEGANDPGEQIHDQEQ